MMGGVGGLFVDFDSDTASGLNCSVKYLGSFGVRVNFLGLAFYGAYFKVKKMRARVCGGVRRTGLLASPLLAHSIFTAAAFSVPAFSALHFYRSRY